MNSALLRLTKLHICLFAGGRFVRTLTMKTPNGEDEEVAIFSSSKPTSLGQCTPFKTIVIHESALNNERLSDYAFIHEMGHKKQWWSLFKIPLCLLILLGLINGQWVPLFALTIATLVAFSWILELNADFGVISQIGVDAFLEVRGEVRRIYKPTLSSIIVSWLTHPPVGVTIRIWRLLHRQTKL